MKKVRLIFFVCIAAVLMCAPSVFAAGSAAEGAVENPNLKVMINGKTGEYADTSIIINQRSLLPLRELLVSIGVENDDEHIIWNDAEKSIVINHQILKDNKLEPVKITLKIDSVQAYVNDAAITLDAPAVLYKGKTYVPARFVAQSLGKKVVWEGKTSTVLIKDEAEYKKIEDILTKSNTAMDEIKNVKFKSDSVLETSANGTDYTAVSSGSGEMDVAKKTMHLNMNVKMLGQDIDSEMYMADNAIYVKNIAQNNWIKTVLPEEQFNAMYDNSNSVSVLKANEVLYAGLTLDETSSADEIVLKGDIYIEQFANMQASNQNKAGIMKLDFKKVNVQIHIDKASMRIAKMVMDFDIDITLDKQKMHQKQLVTVTFTEYNGNFEVSVPEEVEKNSVSIDAQ